MEFIIRRLINTVNRISRQGVSLNTQYKKPYLTALINLIAVVLYIQKP